MGRLRREHTAACRSIRDTCGREGRRLGGCLAV